MIEIKELEIDGKLRVELQGRLYSVRDNPIGVREKFWIVRRGGNVIVESPQVTDMLFKYNRSSVSCENLGEVLACNIFQVVGLPTVDYFLAKTTKLDGTEVDGVLCGSFKASNREIETSVFTVQTVYTDMEFDKETGEVINKEINTVNSIMNDLSATFPGENNGSFFFPYIKNSLIEQALMDFITAQTDRHWLNTTFLENYKDVHHVIRKSRCYDNGCIAFLKRKQEAVRTIVGEIKGDYLNSPRMKLMMDKYCPMFGIKTSTVKIDTRAYKKYNSIERLTLKDNIKNVKNKFIDELTDEIIYNPEISMFYKNMLYSLKYNESTGDIDLSPVVNELKLRGDTLPYEILEMTKGVMIYQINELEKTLDKKMEDIRKNRKEEAEPCEE